MELTALVDCVFLLLIFFLLTSTYLNRSQIGIELAPVRTGEQVTDGPEPLEIVVERSGAFMLGKAELDEASLRARLLEAGTIDPDAPVSVLADREAPAGRVLFALDAAREAGLTSVDLVGKQGPGNKTP
jgi:biopolymer transport protein ExbD